MGYENSAGLGVHNQYGPRASGGEEGVFKTYGKSCEYVVELPSAGLNYAVPKADRGGVVVTSIDLNFVTGTVTAITIGGVAVYNSVTAVPLPVKLTGANTGVVVVTGGTDGPVVIGYEDIAA